MHVPAASQILKIKKWKREPDEIRHAHYVVNENLASAGESMPGWTGPRMTRGFRRLQKHYR